MEIPEQTEPEQIELEIPAKISVTQIDGKIVFTVQIEAEAPDETVPSEQTEAETPIEVVPVATEEVTC